MSAWATPHLLLVDEIRAREEEGCTIPAELRRRIAALHPVQQAWDHAAIDPLYEELMALPADPALLAREPNDLDAIRALRPDGPRDLRWRPGEDELVERLHGAWTARAAGCALGKPVEGKPVAGVPGRVAIRRYLEARGDWPLTTYFSARDGGDGLTLNCPESQRERIRHMPDDDDIHYTLIALAVLEERGHGFAWDDVARMWTSRLPFSWLCTAEGVAMLNFWNRSARIGPGGRLATPQWTRRHRNPYRHWIGAQIRSDGWAYACAGRPELAAELAWRDASWTHEANGIYGAMLFAAMQAAAFVEHDAARLIAIGLSEIPRDCRLAHAVRAAVRWARECPDWWSCMERVDGIHREVGLAQPLDGGHTIFDAAIDVISLLYGGMDPHRCLAISVMCGGDTDCDGATVGSIVGAAAGRAGIAPELADPLHDLIKPHVFGFESVRMIDLARRHARVWRTIDEGVRDGRGPVAKASAGASAAP